MFNGALTALVTPFHDGEVDEQALRELVEFQIQGGIDYAGVLKSAGGSIDVVDLPDAGIKGNSHMMMMDKNNGQVASLIQNWLEGKGLTKKP